MTQSTYEIDETGKTTLNLCGADPDPLTFEQDPWAQYIDNKKGYIEFPAEWELL